MKRKKLSAFAGYFKLCMCGRHARLITSEGKHSFEFASKEDGYEMLHRGYQNGRFNNWEFSRICRQITDSNLPDYNHQLDFRVKLFVRSINDVNKKPELLSEVITPEILYSHDFWIHDLLPINTWLM